MKEKPLTHVRVQLPPYPELNPSIGQLRSCHVGSLLVVSGTVIRTGTVKTLEAARTYECTRCKHRFRLQGEPEQDNLMQLPRECPSGTSTKAELGGKPCKNTAFSFVEGTQECSDYQEVKVQEHLNALGMGSTPRGLVVVLTNDLVEICKAGDAINVTGRICMRWRNVYPGVRCDLEMLLIANHVQLVNEKKMIVDISEEEKAFFRDHWRMGAAAPVAARDQIIDSICPQIKGLFLVKLAVMLTLVGGVPRLNTSGSKIRGQCHLLLVGDPGTGKSQFLKYAAKVSPRSVLTTGMGSTSAGLTVTAVKDGGEWHLEAGALVLGDGGICCIDEFNCMRDADRSIIHEAMEQQTLSVAKAGLVTTLQTETTVFGACNPKGRYSSSDSLSVNCAISGPLLSRFDLVMVLLDQQDPAWDETLSRHIIQKHCNNPSPTTMGHADASHGTADHGAASHGAAADGEPAGDASRRPWPIDRLQKYICFVKETLHPNMTPPAEDAIIRYYRLQRSADGRNAARTTVRLLESLVRLATAHARLMCRPLVTTADVVVAITLMDASLDSSAVLQPGPGPLHSVSPDDPDAAFAEASRRILDKLGMHDVVVEASDIRPPLGTLPLPAA
eukprot:jgi/Mesvir1/13834/Mv15983-RA.1